RNGKSSSLLRRGLEKLAPQVGLEPTTLRLTAGCSAIELLRNRGLIRAADDDSRARRGCQRRPRNLRLPTGIVPLVLEEPDEIRSTRIGHGRIGDRGKARVARARGQDGIAHR